MRQTGLYRFVCDFSYIKFAKKADLGSLKSDVDELDIGKLRNVAVDLK